MGRREKATFAGGCFWCMVKPFDEQPGIIDVVSGYTGEHLKIRHMNKSKQVKQDTGKRLKLPLIRMSFPMTPCLNSIGRRLIRQMTAASSSTAAASTALPFSITQKSKS